MATYDETFYSDLDETATPSARRIVPMVLELWPADSVIDVGCGDGAWLSIFADRGVSRIHGVDGDWIADSALKIPLENFERRRLDRDLDIGGAYDLAMSVEVAEHLAPEMAADFVAALCRLAPVVLFSAAIPHQGGVAHYNEQWPDYWAALFAGHGYRTVDTLRQRLWDSLDVTWWYKQNLMIYASEAALARSPRLQAAQASSPEIPPALVHPEKYLNTVKQANPSFGRALRQVATALKRSLSRA